MSYKPTVFNQLFNFIPRYAFEKSVKRYDAVNVSSATP